MRDVGVSAAVAPRDAAKATPLVSRTDELRQWENTQSFQLLDVIRAATNKRGIYILDRGGNCAMLYRPLLE